MLIFMSACVFVILGIGRIKVFRFRVLAKGEEIEAIRTGGKGSNRFTVGIFRDVRH